MTSNDPFERFAQKYNAGAPSIVQSKLPGDLETPVSAYLKIAREKPNSFLLESVEGGETLGRYSIIGMAPDVIWRCRGAASEINRNAQSPDAGFSLEDGPPLENLKRLLAQSEIDLPEDTPPMAAGVFGYLGYNMVRQLEPLGARPAGGLDTDDSIFIRPTLIIVFDNVRQEIRFFTPIHPRADVSAADAWDAAHKRLEDGAEALNGPVPQSAQPSRQQSDASQGFEIKSNTTIEAFTAMVKRSIEYIRAGDIFQVVLSQRFSTPFTKPPFSLYRSLRRTNPSPFMFFLNFSEFSLVGSSPEILVRVRDGEITIRPIAGTRRRGKTPQEDIALEKELLADPKERAEHLMLLDLGRNDVGRAAKLGTVRPTDTFTIERYSHVMHIVSNVIGELRSDTHPIDAVMGGFPAGTVSGAPKVRAMQIIDELEHEARGVYGGAIGYFSADGNVDTCIALRTGVVKDGQLYVQAGGGIVADSHPQAEHEEAENKARALFHAARNALSSN